MRRFLMIAGIVVVLVVGAAGAMLMFPQISEMALKLTCSMTDPSKSCQDRMVAMGHAWSLKGDLERATLWYARAAQKHHPAALFHLAWAVEQGGYAQLHEFIGQAADTNNGFGSEIDLGTPRAGRDNFEAAEKLYRMSANEGFAPAMNNLADLYLSGVAGEGRAEEAFKLHSAAAKAGNPVASLNLSLDYKIGRGVAADSGAAAKYATVTPQSGSPDLGTLTLGRTTFGGTAIDPHMVAMIRAAAEHHEPLTVNFSPMKPDPRLPTFHEIPTPFN